MWRDVLIALAPAFPALGAFLLAALRLRRNPPSERLIALIASLSLALSGASVIFAAGRFLAGGMAPLDVRLGHWFQTGDYGFALVFLVDSASLPCALLAAVLLLATSRFSANYLHREPGFHRFFALVLAFAAGIQLLLLGGSLDLVFAGWEVVGLTSVLLVGFFHDRAGPVRAAIRVLVTYRICDVGLLLAAVLLHHERHTTVFADALRAPHEHAGSWGAAALGLSLLVAAMGKSAQFPVGGWLPRAMEGPTASSAVFYGGLSVHAGVFLLIRTAPFYEHAPVVRVALVIVGLVTAVMASLSGQVSPDAKASLAYATIAQVGLMFVECGLGLPKLALLHLVTHAILRYYQFLRTPSVLQDALARRSALRATEADESAARWELFGVELRRYLYRLAIERFEVEATLERWVARPALALSARLDALERGVMDRPDAPRHSVEMGIPEIGNLAQGAGNKAPTPRGNA
ncbi:MAG: proton-conducting transporter membrane subunit [Minicystis sp.]